MKLKTISSEELLFSGEIEDDRTNTFLELSDYDWMQYVLRTRFKTEVLGLLDIAFEYYGSRVSRMNIRQDLDGEIKEYTYEYDSTIFERYIRKYMLKHIAQWDDNLAFNGEEIILDFYNDVIAHGTLLEDQG